MRYAVTGPGRQHGDAILIGYFEYDVGLGADDTEKRRRAVILALHYSYSTPDFARSRISLCPEALSVD